MTSTLAVDSVDSASICSVLSTLTTLTTLVLKNIHACVTRSAMLRIFSVVSVDSVDTLLWPVIAVNM